MISGSIYHKWGLVLIFLCLAFPAKSQISYSLIRKEGIDLIKMRRFDEAIQQFKFGKLQIDTPENNDLDSLIDLAYVGYVETLQTALNTAEQATQQALKNENVAKKATEIAQKRLQEVILIRDSLKEANIDLKNAIQRSDTLAYRFLAKSLCSKSLQINDNFIRGNMALQAYYFHRKYVGEVYDNDIYNGLYFAQKLLTNPKKNVFQAHRGPVRDIVLGPGGNTVYTAGSDGNLIAWKWSSEGSITNGKTLLEAKKVISSLALSQDNNKMICFDTYGQAFNSIALNEVANKAKSVSGKDASKIWISELGKFSFLDVEGNIVFESPESRNIQNFYTLREKSFSSLAISRDGKIFGCRK